MLTPIVLGSLWVLSNVETSTKGNADVLVEVEPDWGPAQVAAELAKTNVVKSGPEFQAYAESQGVTTFKPGRYYFYENEGASASLATLRGAPAEAIPDQKLLLPPGLTLAKIADRIGALKNKSRDRFLEVAKSGTIRSKFEPASVQSLEGLTWPDTYFIGATETETQILQRIVTEFDKRATAAGLVAPDVNPYNTTNIAAMVQTEAGNDADMPLIAAVLWNRIAKGMPLQVDATLCYAKGGCPPVPTQRRQAHRLAVQHLQGERPAAHADRDREPGRAHRGPAPGGRRLPVLRGGQEREDILRVHAGRARAQHREGP